MLITNTAAKIANFLLRLKVDVFIVSLFVAVVWEKVHYVLFLLLAYELLYLLLNSAKLWRRARRELGFFREV